MIFETHAHYEDSRYDEDRESLLESMKSKNVGNIVEVSAGMKAIPKILQLIRRYDFMYGTVGVHPEETGDLSEADIEFMKETANNDKIVAIGEIGLDYHEECPTPEVQKKWFRRQLELAKELNKPVIIHSRDACEDTLEILEDYKGIKAVMHCYSYAREVAEYLVKRGFYIGVGGVVTFKNARKLKETVEAVPLERILTETDCPYMAPEPFRGSRNDSSMIKYVIDKIAAVKGLTPEYVEEVTYRNAKEFYGL